MTRECSIVDSEGVLTIQVRRVSRVTALAVLVVLVPLAVVMIWDTDHLLLSAVIAVAALYYGFVLALNWQSMRVAADQVRISQEPVPAVVWRQRKYSSAAIQEILWRPVRARNKRHPQRYSVDIWTSESKQPVRLLLCNYELDARAIVDAMTAWLNARRGLAANAIRRSD